LQKKFKRISSIPIQIWLSKNQRWATASLKIASLSLSLFAENNSGAALPLLNKNSSKLSLPLFVAATFGELNLCCFAKVGFILQSHLEMFFIYQFCWVPLF